jgi:acyl carrier protein
MSIEKEFRKLIAQYASVTPEEVAASCRFREDLGFSSLDFMSLLGEVEDEFDIELAPEKLCDIHTVGEAMNLIASMV